METSEIERAIVYQAKQYVPLPLSEVALDWLKVAEFEDEKGFFHQKILLISVPQEQIKKYQAMFRAVGLTLRALEIESFGLARILGGDPTPTMIDRYRQPFHQCPFSGKRKPGLVDAKRLRRRIFDASSVIKFEYQSAPCRRIEKRSAASSEPGRATNYPPSCSHLWMLY